MSTVEIGTQDDRRRGPSRVNFSSNKVSLSTPAVVGKHLLKTKMCSLFLNGKCHYGSGRCFYAHDSSELRQKPELTKTSYCVAFKTGSCQRGEQCNYAHDIDELTISSKNVQCLWYTSGHCSHGTECRFAHVDTPTDSISYSRCSICGMTEILSGGCLCKVYEDCSAILGLL